MARKTGNDKEEVEQNEDRFRLLVESVRDYAIFMPRFSSTCPCR
jgi:hypothetical protein